MGDAVIEGYINEHKKADFVAYGSPEENYQFTGGLTGSNEVLGKLKNAENLKSPEKIKEEINSDFHVIFSLICTCLISIAIEDIYVSRVSNFIEAEYHIVQFSVIVNSNIHVVGYDDSGTMIYKL